MDTEWLQEGAYRAVEGIRRDIHIEEIKLYLWVAS